MKAMNQRTEWRLRFSIACTIIENAPGYETLAKVTFQDYAKIKLRDISLAPIASAQCNTTLFWKISLNGQILTQKTKSGHLA